MKRLLLSMAEEAWAEGRKLPPRSRRRKRRTGAQASTEGFFMGLLILDRDGDDDTDPSSAVAAAPAAGAMAGLL